MIDPSSPPHLGRFTGFLRSSCPLTVPIRAASTSVSGKFLFCSSVSLAAVVTQIQCRYVFSYHIHFKKTSSDCLAFISNERFDCKNDTVHVVTTYCTRFPTCLPFGYELTVVPRLRTARIVTNARRLRARPGQWHRRGANCSYGNGLTR